MLALHVSVARDCLRRGSYVESYMRGGTTHICHLKHGKVIRTSLHDKLCLQYLAATRSTGYASFPLHLSTLSAVSVPCH